MAEIGEIIRSLGNTEIRAGLTSELKESLPVFDIEQPQVIRAPDDVERVLAVKDSDERVLTVVPAGWVLNDRERQIDTDSLFADVNANVHRVAGAQDFKVYDLIIRREDLGRFNSVLVQDIAILTGGNGWSAYESLSDAD